jgi:hypothetical protein
MMGAAHDRLRLAYQQIVERLGLPPSTHSLQFERHDDGSRHFEQDGEGWKVVTTERGCDYDQLCLPDDEEALFLQTSDLTFSMACDYELAHRIENRDCREMISERQIELMSRISSEWGERMRRQWQATLRSHPLTTSYLREPN